MRLGVFGGTFDPVHYGHLLLAEQCREQCRLDQVWFVPAYQSPHKQDHEPTSGKIRCELLEYALAGAPWFAINRLELDRGGPSFTVETLQTLHAEEPSRELFLLIGADSLADFPKWREPLRILELATLVVVNRGRNPPPVEATIETLGNSLRDRIVTVEMPAVDLSASDIRQRATAGRSLRFMTPRAVEEAIRLSGVYSRK